MIFTSGMAQAIDQSGRVPATRRSNSFAVLVTNTLMVSGRSELKYSSPFLEVLFEIGLFLLQVLLQLILQLLADEIHINREFGRAARAANLERNQKSPLFVFEKVGLFTQDGNLIGDFGCQQNVQRIIQGLIQKSNRAGHLPLRLAAGSKAILEKQS